MKQIISMLASEKSVRLFTITGEMMDLKEEDPYDIGKIIEDLTPKLTGTSPVDFDIEDYSLSGKGMEQYESQGIIMTTTVDGKSVSGIFYPSKIQIPGIEVEGEVIELPGLENLRKHMNRAMAENSDGVKNFLERIKPVLKNRRHSVEDLLEFMKKSELPLTNDGRIIAYKRVKAGQKTGQYLDCHTGNVLQHLGTRVWMETDLVNPDRHQSCSNGLHVANLGYLSGFTGEFTLVVLVNPEDFIAVPHNESTKARVCAYDIIGVLNSYTQDVLNQGAYATDNIDLKTLVQQAIVGDHIQVWETLQIGNRGAMLKREVIPGVMPPNAAGLPEAPAPMNQNLPSGDSLMKDPEPQDLIQQKTPIKLSQEIPSEVKAVFDDLIFSGLSKTEIARQHETSTRTIGRWCEKFDFDNYEKLAQRQMTVPQQARILFNQWRETETEDKLRALLEFKKTKKKSWFALGFTAEEEKQIIDSAQNL